MKAPQAKDQEARQTLGAYYTPQPVAEALVDWAVRSMDDRVLDPTFGGCAFFSAAIDQLSRLGASEPFHQLAGADIDPGAYSYLSSLPGFEPDARRFHVGADFLNLTAADFGLARHDVVVGNPPYLAHHGLSPEQREAAQQAAAAAGHALKASASYWAYFVVHSLSFLAPGGRMAMVLPTALLTADYAATVRQLMGESFASTSVLAMRQRLFPGAQEASVIVLADGRGEGAGRIRVREVATTGALRRLLAKAGPCWRAGRSVSTEKSWRIGLLSASEEAAYSATCSKPEVRQLSELCELSIGLVTGDNGFFVMSPQDAAALGIGEQFLQPVIGKATQLRGLQFGALDLDALSKHNTRCRLLVVRSDVTDEAVRSYLRSKKGRRAAQRQKCLARDVWYCITDLKAPDAFLTCTSGYQPRIVLNPASVPCTNSVYRLWWTEGLTEGEKRLATLSFLTSLTALSAEIVGRTYGGGALKLDVGGALRTSIALPAIAADQVDRTLEAACELIRRGDWSSARLLADELVLRQGLGLPGKTVCQLQKARDRLRRLRLPEGVRTAKRRSCGDEDLLSVRQQIR